MMMQKPLSWRPTPDEVRRIVREMRPILEAQATRADRECSLPERRS